MKRKNIYYVPQNWVPCLKFSVIFSLRVKAGASVGSILVSVTSRGKRFRYALGQHRVPEWHWDYQRQRMIPGTPRAEEINAEIDRYLQAIIFFYSSSRTADAEQPTLEGLKATLFPARVHASKRVDQSSIVGLFQRFIREHTNGGRPLSHLTVKNYKTALSSWQAYEKHCGKKFFISDFLVPDNERTQKARKIIETYQRFLIEVGIGNTPLADNTARKRLKVLSTMFRWAEAELGIQLLRKISMKGETISKYSISLTQHEVEAISKVKLRSGSKLDHVRNMMILALNFGIRHSEYLLVKPELWREPYQLITTPKTGSTCLLIHRPQVRDILKKYEANGFPASLRINQKINREIKEICRLAGLNRLVNKTITRDGIDHHETVELHTIVSTHTLWRTKITLDLSNGRNMRDICLETGQDESTARTHYDRPNLDEHVRRLGIEKSL
jgi:hypothetical protein